MHSYNPAAGHMAGKKIAFLLVLANGKIENREFTTD